jgi:predicted phosphodiesterase
MRFAVVSDIHGNLTALDAVLSDVEKRGGVDRTFCLGDVAQHGPQPKEVIEFLRQSKWPCVMGNTDEHIIRDVLERPSSEDPVESEHVSRLDSWTREHVPEPTREFISTFTPTVEFEDGEGRRFLFYHGSPRSNVERIYPSMPDEELRTCLAGNEAALFAGGHTHAPMYRRLGRSVILNPGSVGRPFEMAVSGKLVHPPRAEYAIVKVEPNSFGVELHAVSYPLEDLRRSVINSGMPNPEWWLSYWY